jgi:peptide/nickel transport system permease protein
MTREALRPSSFSLITLAGVSLGRLIGGTVIVESLFGLPGVGSVVVAAAGKKDYPLVQGGVLIIACAYVLINVLIDISYAILDPRIRRGRI